MEHEFADPHWEAVLRDHGQRVTPARRLVLDVVGSTDSHLSADEIAALVADRAPDVHRATVFRTLSTLVESGILVHVHVPHAPTTYHLGHPHGRRHLHVVCSVCGSVYDTDPTVLDAAVERLRSTIGFELDADHIALSGRCATCAAR